MRKPLLLIAILLLCNACVSAPAPSEPAPPPPTALAQDTPTVPPGQVPTIAPTALLATPTAGSSVATAPPPGPPHPAWIAIQQVGEPIEGLSSISLVDADTGQVVQNVCPSTDGSPLAWSYDGNWLACVTNWLERRVTLVNAVDPTQTYEWTVPVDLAEPGSIFLAWSPVEQTLAVSTEAAIYLIVPDAATQPRVIKTCEGYRCSAIAWSPDGLHLATNDRQGLSVLTIADGSEVSIADEGIYLSGSTPDSRDVSTPLESVAYAPDGSQIAYTAQGGVYVVAAAGGEARQLIVAPYRGTHLVWTQDGRSIEFIGPSRQLIDVAVDGSGNDYGEIAAQVPALVSEPFRCTVTMRATGEAPIVGLPDPGVPPSGPIYDLFVSFTRSEAVVHLTEGGIYGPLLLQEGETTPEISPRLVGAWAPGPVRAPTLALNDPPLRGCAVLELQTLLEVRNFSPGAVDGIYGPTTEEAVRAFQQANNLMVDGIVGPQTWAALGGWWGDR